jgi:hypothetical protein
MTDNTPPPGSDPEPAPVKNGMPKEDRIAFGVMLVIICLIGLSVIWALSTILGPLGGAIDAAGAGVGLRDAFLVALPVSFAVIILFALVAGDGLVGELGAMLVGFFVMLLFFTSAIAIIF